ncbi:MAG TPA: protein kinase [Candidatus Dormibacteraeota bacterium]|nr:protein kinase [Candidatus Dormibacteraeota bacterium]
MDQSWKQWQGRSVNEEFQLREYLGGSQHSVVFLTERPGKNPQKAAIKLIPANSTNAEVHLSRWQSAARLSHPNLLHIFETGRCRLDNVDLLYLVTEYAEENLSQILLQRPLTPQETREMLDPVLDALLYLHGKGFVHGSIKPSNIMAVADQLKMSSDGACGMGSSVGDLHSPDSAYASPETAANVSPASDVWSLGMTLVEVLTQRLPTWDPADSQFPESVTQTLPESFLDIARHALQRDPARRWNIGQIAARLQSNPLLHPTPVSVPLSTEPPLPRAKSRPQQESKFSSPRYLVPSVAAACILAGVILMPRFLGQHPRAAHPTRPESSPAQLAVPSAVPHAARENADSSRRPTNSLAPAAKANPAVRAPLPAILRPEEKNLRTSTVPDGGAVLHQVLPDVSAKARDTIHGTVKIGVRVRVNPAGKVTEANLENLASSKYFADLSLRAARQWTFRAPGSDGRKLPSEWLVHFYFTPSATRAVLEKTTH